MFDCRTEAYLTVLTEFEFSLSINENFKRISALGAIEFESNFQFTR